MRTFVAVDLPEEVKQIVRELQRPLREFAGLALTKPHQCHLTLKFLGETSAADVDRFIAALREIQAAPLRLSLAGIGAFPSPRKPRVIWLGIAESAALSSLVRAVDLATNSVPADRAFHPHVTLARVRHTGVNPDLRALGEQPPECAFDVAEFVLYQSELSSNGADHQALCRFPLIG